MMLKKALATVTGAVLLSGALFAGVALATEDATTAAPIFKQLADLRQSYREKLKTESEALINQALAAGTISQEQADKMLAQRGKPGPKLGGPRLGGNPGGMKHRFGRGGMVGPGPGWVGRTQDEVQTNLDRHVQEGDLTQDQADQMLQRWLKAQAK